MDEFEKELKVGFLEEAGQLLADTEQCFLGLETSGNDTTIIDKIFRLAHSLKGSAKAVGFEQMGAFAHVFESFLLKIKNGEVPKSAEVISLLLLCNDFLNESVKILQADLGASIDASELLVQLEAGLQGKFTAVTETAELEAPVAAPPIAPADDTSAVLMAAKAFEQMEEEVSSTPSVAPAVAPPANAPKVKANTEESIRVSVARLERLINMVGEMVILQTVLREQAYRSDPTLLRKSVQQLGKVTKEVQDISLSLRMVPIKQTFQKMQRIVRDTATLLGKKVNLHLMGEETELDKTVLESISDPLVHMIRNAVDHGIESVEKRQQAGKPIEGNVYLSAFHESGRLVIEIRDDGGGIDGAYLLEKAKQKGLLAANAKLTDEEAVRLIFHAGFSTKQEVTEVSGRGVGMDVVRTNIENLQGEIRVSTNVGKGSTFRIILPLTLAIIDGMVVRSGEERFVIPLSQVHESVRPSEADVQFNTGLGETMILRGECLPVLRLTAVLGRKATHALTDSIAIVIRTTAKPFAILVDDILGQNQIVIKKLGAELQRLSFFSGSAVLGDGRPAFILDPPELVKLFSTTPVQNFSASKSAERIAA